MSRLPRSQVHRIEVLAVANLACLLVIFALLREGASFRETIGSAVVNVAPTLLAALGLTGIICAGAIDLSIGAIIAVAGVALGVLAQRGAPPWLAFGACISVAFGLSVLNAWAIRLLRIPAIIWTLAALALYRGVALIAADLCIPAFSGNISIEAEAYHLPGKAWSPEILLAAVACALWFERCGRTPRHWLAVGASGEACRLQGLDPDRIRLGAFAAGGIFLGLAALLQATQVQAIEPARLALGFELPVIGAVVLGGANIFGGEGGYLGTILGAFLLHLTEQILLYAGVSVYWREVLSGASILAVIGIDCWLHRDRKRLEELR